MSAEHTNERYPIPADAARTELRIVNSRFIGSAAYTPTVAAARAYIDQVRAEMPAASHHAYAYLVGYGASVTAGMSDAGEPAGTAGRPMLAVLRGSDLGDVTVVGTRYFGGTLLGTGGLVRAYGDTTRAVLAVLPRGEHVVQQALLIAVPYSSYTLVRQALAAHQATVDDEDFAAEVTIMARLPQTELAACRAALITLTAGQAEIVAGPVDHSS